jgi:Terminase large subunit, T4likevirus-type, N-terminal
MAQRSFAAELAEALNPAPVDAFKILGYEPACVPYIAGQIEAPCGQCPQELFAADTETYSVLLGGSAGGGKTLSVLMFAIRTCAEHPRLRVGVFRRSYPELRESLLAELAAYGFAHALGASWNGTEYELRFPNVSIIRFRYAETLKDATRRQGGQYQLLVLDERRLFPPDVASFLESRVRSGRADIPVIGIRSTANPGGQGHQEVKKRFIDATNYGERIVTDERGREVRFVPAKLADNPHLNPEYAADLRALPEKLRRAFLDGDWQSFAGAVFPELNRDRHVVRPFTIPAPWPRYVGVDWAYTAPWAAVWAAQDEDGRPWVYREIHETGVGEADQAKRILAAELEGEHVAVRWADDAMWSVRGDAKPIADVYAEQGCHLTPAGKGPGSPVAGWQRIHSYLAEGPACPHHRGLGWSSCPRLHLLSACESLWGELSPLPHATVRNVEDADTKAADHASDALRYLVTGLGTGPEFVVFTGDDREAGSENTFGIEVLAAAGIYGVRCSPVDALFDSEDVATSGERIGGAADGADEAGAAYDRLTDVLTALGQRVDGLAGSIDVLTDSLDTNTAAVDENSAAMDANSGSAERAGGASEGIAASGKLAFLGLSAALVYSVVKAGEYQSQMTTLLTQAGFAKSQFKQAGDDGRVERVRDVGQVRVTYRRAFSRDLEQRQRLAAGQAGGPGFTLATAHPH